MFKCNHCVFQGDYKQNLKRHMKNMHEKNTPTTKDEDTPKAEAVMHVDMQHGLGIGGAQDNQTVSIQGYNNIIEETYKWKDAYEGQKQGNIMKDNAIKIRDMHLLKSNEKIAAMGKDMGRIINKYEILKKKKLNKRDNKND